MLRGGKLQRGRVRLLKWQSGGLVGAVVTQPQYQCPCPCPCLFAISAGARIESSHTRKVHRYNAPNGKLHENTHRSVREWRCEVLSNRKIRTFGRRYRGMAGTDPIVQVPFGIERWMEMKKR